MTRLATFVLSLFAASLLPAANPVDKTDQAPPAVLPPGLNEADRAKILERVKQLQEEFDRQKHDITKGGIARFEAAAASEVAAVEFQLACQKIVHDRVPDLDASNDKIEAKIAQDKVKQQVEAFEAAPGRATAVRTQLEFLVLTLKAPTIKDESVLVAKAREIVNKAMTVVKTFASPNAETVNVKKLTPVPANPKTKVKAPSLARISKEEDKARKQIIQTMRQDVMDSIFSQAYNLKNYFKPVDRWGDSALHLAGFYENLILPWFREHKRDDLPAIWDEYVGHELALHRCSEDDPEFAKWGITGYKDLLWDKSMDLLTYGNHRAQSLDELSKLIKENPSHPRIERWVESISALAETLKGPADAPVVDATK